MAYHGAPCHGFADNPGVPTVAGVLNESLGRAVGEPVVVTCAGRTDRGVHALGQVVSFDVPDGTDLGALAFAAVVVMASAAINDATRLAIIDF